MRCNCASRAVHVQVWEAADMLLDFDRLGALRWALLSVGVGVALFLLLPIVFIAALSFGDSQWLIFPPPGWTLRWYEDLFADPRWLQSAWVSAEVAAAVTVLSVILGLLARSEERRVGKGCRSR